MRIANAPRIATGSSAILVVLFAALSAAALSAATVTGTVRDPSEAVVPAVTIELRDDATGQSTSIQADPAGQFHASNLRAGRYQITIAHPGFQAYTQTVNLEESSPARIEIRLKLAEIVQDFRVSSKGALAPNSDPNYRKLRDSQPEETFVVKDLVIRRDVGVFTLRSGTISFTPAVLGRVTKAVFVGEGEFALKPAIWFETNYLKRMTGKDAVLETFRELVLCFTDNTYDEIRAAATAGPAEARSKELLENFHRHVRQRSEQPRSQLEAMLTDSDMENVEAETLADLYNPSHPGFFSAYIAGRQHNHLQFHVKPRGALPFLPAPEEVALINLDPLTEQEGIWYLTHYASEIAEHRASSHEDKRAISARKYRIETVIGKNDHLTAIADLQFRAVTDGDRLIDFSLLPALRVSRITSDTQQELSFIQEDRRADGSLHVILPEPMVSGRDYRVVIEYSGDRVIHKSGGGNFSVGARTSWYPSVNAFTDRATYDLTFKVPNRYTLVSVGKLVKEWREEDFAASQWVSDIPLAVAGFNYGSFKKKQITDAPTKYEIEGYATTDVPDYLRGTQISNASPSSLTERVMGETQNALRIFAHWFGAAPYGRIAITQQPEFNFGQSWPGLVYLPMSAYLDSTQRWMLMGQISQGLTAFIQEVTPHEVAHQWWGHIVGWTTFHDQWLSEGFADFSAGLYLQVTEPRPGEYFKYLERARDLILDKNTYGRSPNDAGPIWMGLRLNTLKDEGAYNRIVYPKGGYVLHMLRMMMYDAKTGDQGFKEMMHDFVQSHFHQNASTESFKAVVEKHMTPAMDLENNHRMDWFFSQWVFGTDIPRYKFDYTLSKEADGSYQVKASLTQSEVSAGFAALVPIYVDFDAGRIQFVGRARMIGASTVNDITFKLPQKPKRVLINGRYDVLARK
jgi:hypothetical protein